MGQTSEKVNWDHGVPQGSLLGPLLYIIATNLITELLNRDSSKIFMFADDIAIIVSNKKVQDAVQEMKKTIKYLQQITHDLGLTINMEKTKFMHVRSRGTSTLNENFKYHEHPCLHLENINCTCSKTIDFTEQHKYLGVQIDSKFKFAEQFNLIT